MLFPELDFPLLELDLLLPLDLELLELLELPFLFLLLEEPFEFELLPLEPPLEFELLPLEELLDFELLPLEALLEFDPLDLEEPFELEPAFGFAAVLEFFLLLLGLGAGAFLLSFEARLSKSSFRDISRVSRSSS